MYKPWRPSLWLSVLCLAGCATSSVARQKQNSDPAPPFLIRGAKIFDGESLISATSVLVRDGLIVALDPKEVPPNTRTIDGSDKTLLPGLIDTHNHPDSVLALEQALAFGVTTVMGMTGNPSFSAARRAEEKRGSHTRSQLFSAGWAITVEEGLGSGFPGAKTLRMGEDPVGFVSERLAEGSDYLEIMYDHGTAWGTTAPALSKRQLGQAVQAAKKSHTTALVDIATHRETRDALEAGIDGFAHLYVEGPNPEVANAIADSKAFVIATLPVLFSICDGTRGAKLARLPHVAKRLAPSEHRRLRQAYRILNPGIDCDGLLAAVRELKGLGVPVLAGSDAPSPGTTYGASLHDGMALLVDAGLSPLEALAAATSLPAGAFGLRDRGRIAPGYRADLVLIEGDPTEEIKASTNVSEVWKAGVRLDLAASLVRIQQGPRDSDQIEPKKLGVFRGSTDGWLASSDRIQGGGSSSALSLSNSQEGVLVVTGEVKSKKAGPTWAGAMILLGNKLLEPVAIDSARSLSFKVRGSPGNYRVQVFTVDGGSTPISVGEFRATNKWSPRHVYFKAMPETTRREVVGILIDAGAAARKFRLELEDILIE